MTVVQIPKQTHRAYDGALYCQDCDKCPVVDVNKEDGQIYIHHPDQPEKGTVKMSKEEFNNILRNMSLLP